MKKTNKKGFTLIELLAVIIILGVLMIIAIPSVTQYISSSRKTAMADSAASYIDGTRTMVNEARRVQFFDTNTLYLVPVGHDTDASCVSLEKGGKSPFSDVWEYAYVGVTYNGSSYSYYFVAKDGSNQGINFVSQADLANEGGDLVVSGSDFKSTDFDFLKTPYSTPGTGKTYYKTVPEGGSGEALPSFDNVVKVVTDAEQGKTISQIIVVPYDQCKNK